MLNLICRLVEKIVFSGVNGIILIPLLLLVIYVIFGQAKETLKLFKELGI